jgi:hypothetical protein
MMAGLAALVAFAPWHTGNAQQPAAPPTTNLSSSLGLFIYPGQGQSPEQQRNDESECYGWAKQQTHIDPIAGIKADTAPQQQQVGGAVGGAARGAAAGALIGAAAGDAGAGAAIGAATGGVGGRLRQRRSNDAQAQQQQEQAQQSIADQRHTFNRAFAACMQTKSYTIN